MKPRCIAGGTKDYINISDYPFYRKGTYWEKLQGSIHACISRVLAFDYSLGKNLFFHPCGTQTT
jgi:hypothetical protein